MAAVTRQDGAGADAKFAYCARIQRDSGNSQTDQMRFHTALETKDVELLRGEVLTISYYARKGANYSEANSKITGVRIATGENILRASDDPVGSVELSGLNVVKKQIEQYERNVNSANDRLSLIDKNLENLSNVFVRVQELIIQASSDVLGLSLIHI